jgi:hypothetical protein
MIGVLEGAGDIGHLLDSNVGLSAKPWMTA